MCHLKSPCNALGVRISVKWQSMDKRRHSEPNNGKPERMQAVLRIPGMLLYPVSKSNSG
jgi:hypothetical protein